MFKKEEKTKCVAINSTYKLDLEIDSEEIECASEIKSLGVIIENKSSFNGHIDYFCKKNGKESPILEEYEEVYRH